MKLRDQIAAIQKHVAPYRKYFWLSVLLTIMLSVIGPLRPYLIQVTIDDYTRQGLRDQIFLITVIQLGLLLLEALVRYGFMYWVSVLGQSVVADMRDTLFTRITTRNINFFHKNPIGTLSTRVVNDMETVNKIFSEGLISIVGDILLMVSTLVVMLSTNWRLTLIALLTLPLIWVATIWFKNAVKISFEKVRTAVASLNTYVQEHLSGLYIIQAFGKEQETMTSFEVHNEDFTRANIQTIFAYAVYFPIVELLSAVSVVILVWYGTLGDGQFFTTGQLVAFILYINMLFRPLRMMADKFNVIQMGMISLERVLPLMEEDEQIEHGVLDTAVDSQVFGTIRYDHVDFAYDQDIDVLRDLELEISPGEKVALIGATGSGKTTIINLLSRLYDDYTGVISIDDRDTQSIGLAELRQSVGMITQDVMLISGTLADNIRMQHDDITHADLDRIATELGIIDYIDQLYMRWDYPVGHQGSALSLGQKQLVAFLRVMVLQPQILVLDEATASIDLETEVILQNALDKISENRTMIIIAHRLHTIKSCDSIYMLEDHKLRRIDSYQEILSALEDLGITSDAETS